MNSQVLVWFLGVQYLVIMILCLAERNYIKALYWFGAVILNLSVVLMK